MLFILIFNFIKYKTFGYTLCKWKVFSLLILKRERKIYILLNITYYLFSWSEGWSTWCLWICSFFLCYWLLHERRTLISFLLYFWWEGRRDLCDVFFMKKFPLMASVNNVYSCGRMTAMSSKEFRTCKLQLLNLEICDIDFMYSDGLWVKERL